MQSVWKDAVASVHSSFSTQIAFSGPGTDDKTSFITSTRTDRNISVWKWKQGDDSRNPREDAPFSANVSSEDTAEATDIVSVAESLVETPTPSFLDVREVLAFIERLDLCCGAIGSKEDETRLILALLLDLARRLRKLNLTEGSARRVPAEITEYCDRIIKLSYDWTSFQLLMTSDAGRADGNGTSLREKWRLFKNTNLLSMLEHYMKKGAMRPVMILWSRHADDSSARSIPKLLQCLPTSLPIGVYEKWLQGEVLPAIIKCIDESIDDQADKSSPLLLEVAQWLFERARSAAERGDVATAIRLSRLLKSSGEEPGAACSYFEYRVHTLGEVPQTHPSQHEAPETRGIGKTDALQSLEQLATSLEHIKHLADVHQFKISLQLFADETPSTIAMSMMDRVLSPEQLREDIDNHVKKYLHHCKTHPDQVLKDYVAELADSISTPQSTEEARALVVLDSIDSIELRADTALTLFRSVLPPYSDLLKEYARKSATVWESVRQEEIQEHFRMMEIQDMLMAYGVKQFDMADARNASRLLGHILVQISRPSALDDAMRLVDAYSHLQCDRAAVQFIENLLTFPPGPDAKLLNAGFSHEISSRTAKAVDALSHVKKRKAIASNTMLLLSLMEEVVELGLTLLEIEEHQNKSSVDHLSDPRNVGEPRILEEGDSSSFLLGLVFALVSIFVSEVQSLHEYAASTRNESVLAYLASPDFILNEKLLADLQKLQRIEAEHKTLLSVSTLRDPERIEAKVKKLMKPDMLFGDEDAISGSSVSDTKHAREMLSVARGKGKKRGADWPGDGRFSEPGGSKRVRAEFGVPAISSSSVKYDGKQQDERQAQYASNLNRLASSVGISPSKYRSMTAQLAAQNGWILRAVRYSRDLFSRRCGENKRGSSKPGTHEMSSSGGASAEGLLSKLESAETLKSISMSISWYTATHVDEVYSLSKFQNQYQTPSQIARMQAPVYSLELLRYSICVCEVDSFEETFVLLKNAVLLNEVLHHTQLDLTGKERGADEWANWKLYNRWFRGDASVLPSADAMRFATHFAVAEHKKLVSTEARGDSISSKRYVSFLVENNSDLLSLKVLLSMRDLPEDATSVVQSQVAKLLSTVFQSQEIDNYFALGYVFAAHISCFALTNPRSLLLLLLCSHRLMLTLEQVDAFNAFKRQISRENVAKDFNRFQQLALIGSDAARAWQQIAFLHQCVELEGNARWWHYLNLLGIECDHKAFQSERRDLTYIRRLVPALIEKSNYDFYMVLEFTRHYQIDDNYPSLAYVEALLLKKGESTDDLEYQDKIVGVLEDIHDQHLVSLLLKSIPKISGFDYDRLAFVFRLLLENTKYPDRDEVERRVEVLHIMRAHAAIQARKAATTDGTQLDVMKSSRVRPGGQVSFHDLIAKPRDLLSQLLNKDNFGTLFELVGPLRLQTDELQMLLLKSMVETYLRPTLPETRSKAEHFEPTPPFEVFHEILSRLTDIENKVTAGEWLAENFPYGEEKMKALEFALASARSDSGNEKDGGETAGQTFTGTEAFTRLETKILRLKVELILREELFENKGLDSTGGDAQNSELLQLISQPAELFCELYRRYSLASCEGNCKNIHEVADRVADLLQISANKLRRELVNEWLVKDAVLRVNASPPAESIFEPLEDEKMQRKDEEYIKRLAFVAAKCVHANSSSGVELFEHLIRFAKDVKPRAGVTFRAKLRALRVVLRLSQLYQPMVASVLLSKYQLTSSESFFKDLVNYARHCSHMVAFEEHRVPYDIAYLLKADKAALVRSILRQYSVHSSWVLRCVSRLMLDFNVQAADLWEAVLSSMLKLKMVRSLSSILGPLSKASFIRGLDNGSDIWECVLLQPLLELKSLQSEWMQFDASDEIRSGHFISQPEDVDRHKKSLSTTNLEKLKFGGISIQNVRVELEHMVTLLQKCPFLDQIDVTAFVIHLRDLTEIAEYDSSGGAILKSLDFYGFAVRCALVIPKPQTRFEALLRIIQAGAYMPVLRELSDTSCLLSGDESEHLGMENEDNEFGDQLRLMQGAFAEATKRGGYKDLLSTPFESAFIEFLAATGNIDRLLAIL